LGGASFLLGSCTILAQFDLQPYRVAYPFKLNPTWLLEDDFSVMVKEVWADPVFLVESDFQHQFLWKLKVLKTGLKFGLGVAAMKSTFDLRLWRRN
jgi:hypothetical protein